MIPVLQDLVKTNEKDCVQAIFLYPLNALMKSQQKRIHAWCNALPEKVTYAIYNGDTDKENRSDRHTLPYYSSTHYQTSDKEDSTTNSLYQSDNA